MRAASFRRYLIAATVLSSQFIATQALADCVSQAPVHPEQVVCDNPGTIGWNGATTNAIVVTVNSGATVNSSLSGWPALISTGTNSAVINFAGSYDPLLPPVFGIDAGSATDPAIAVGAGTTVTNSSGAAINGTISFGNATGTQVNALNNNYSSSGATNNIGLINGRVIAVGNLAVNNMGVIGLTGGGGITQTGAGSVVINNGIDGGYASTYTLGGAPMKNGVIWGSGSAISTQGSTSLVNHGGGSIPGSVISANVTLGALGTGTSSITNGSQAFGNATIVGNVTMADKDNTVTNDGTITGNVIMNGTGSNTYNAGSSGSAGDNGLRLPGSQVGGAGVPTGVVVGTLTGLAANSANNVLNLNGTDSSTLQAGSSVVNFGVVNKNDSGTWTIKNTLDGAAGKLTSVNVTGGRLSADNAAFLGSAATTVKLANGTVLVLNGTAAGTFAGNIVDASGATSGGVLVTGATTTTLSGANSYSGTTTIDGGTLATGSDGALSANSAVSIGNGGTLIVNNATAVKSLVDFGAGANAVNLNGNATSLTLTGGNWGALGGTVTGTGTLIKNGTGQLDLAGVNAVNLTAPGTFRINDGGVSVAVANAISAATAVQVNSAATTTGVLNVNANDTIGSLAGSGANATVNIASGMVLTTGGLNASTTYAGKILGAGSLVKDGSGLMVLSGANAYTGGTTVNDGAIIGFVGTGASITGNYTLNNDGFLTFNQLLPASGPQSGTYAGNVTGAATAYMQFGGNSTTKVTLTGDNSGFAGTSALGFGSSTIGQGGTVSIGSANNIGTGTLLFYDGVLESTATMTLANAVSLQTTSGGGIFNTATGTTLTLTGPITGGGALLKTGTGTLALSGAPGHTGGTTISAGTLRTPVWSTGDIVNNANLELIGCQPPTNVACFHNGVISGTGNVRITGDSGVAFGGLNTYTGTTTIDAGSALLSWAAGVLSAQSSFVVNGALFLGGADQTIGSLSGSGVVSTGANTLNIGANNSSTTFAGTFGAYPAWTTESLNVNKIGTGTLTLSGTGSVLTGNLGVNAGTLSLTGTLASATTTVASGAILSVDGTLTSPTVTVASGGRLVGGIGTTSGKITGAVANSGTIAPGHSPGIIAITGSYAQTSTGTYAAEVFANGTGTVVAGVDYDRIAVSGAPGTATLAGTLAVTPNGGLYVAGTAYDIITTTGGITGNFGTITGNVISPFITLSNAMASGGGVVGNNYRLVVVRSAYNTVATNPNQVAVANGLTGIIGSAGAASTVTKIDNMTAAQAQALFTSASPEPYGGFATALQDQAELFTRQVAHRQAESDGAGPGMGVWANLYGSWGNGKDRGDYRFGNDHSIVGGAAGVDFSNGDLRVGVAGGYSEDDVTYLGGNSEGKSKSWQVGGYLSYGMDKLRIDGQVAYVSGDITATKLVNAGSGATLISGTAAVDTQGDLIKGIVTLGYDVGGERFTFVPYVGIDFTSGKIDGFTETGMGTLNLTVAEIEADRTDLVVGARLAAPMGMVTPYLNAAYRYDLSDHPGAVTAFFNGVSTAPFTVSTIGSGRSVVDVDAGLSARIGPSVSLFVGYQGTFRNDLENHGVNGGLRMSF